MKKMEKLKLKFQNTYLLFLVFISVFLFNIVRAQAVTIYFESRSSMIYQDNTFIVDLKISTPDTEINVLEGTILYDKDKLELKEISTGNSIFSLWPKPPTIYGNRGELSFIGGVPKGFKGKTGDVFKIIFTAKKNGQTKLDFLDDVFAFLNDGKGTQISPQLKSLTLEILERSPGFLEKDEWQELIAQDKIPPKFVEAIISRNPNIFDNKYFVSFFATDEGAGINYYEIKEGDNEFKRIESPYVLKDQTLKGAVQIKAVDKAGNESIIIPEISSATGTYYNVYLILIVVGLFIFVIIFWIWRLLLIKKSMK